MTGNTEGELQVQVDSKIKPAQDSKHDSTKRFQTRKNVVGLVWRHLSESDTKALQSAKGKHQQLR
jgi:hypothetical protein